METAKYLRKSFTVEAVQVSDENLEAVSDWCNGDIRTARVDEVDERYIKVRVSRPQSERQTKAFAGDWVLEVNRKFKVYTNQAFIDSFELV